MALLEVDGLSKRFGGLVVLDGVSLAVEQGRIHGVIGPNGAGKTTLFNIINGIYRATAGRVVFKGRDITNRKVHRIAALGLGRTFQVARVFAEMTLLENLLVAAVPYRLPRAEARCRALELLELAQLDHLRDQPAIEVSGGQQKLLEFARTLMARPALVLLDEPFSGISPALIERLIEMVGALNRERGTTFLLISHEIPEVAALCELVTVLAGGKVVARGTPAEVRRDEAVIEAYLGH
jgi:branched-chain amino acid transport system ATP-binding protein